MAIDIKQKNWTVLSSEYLFRELWFTVRKDTCETPEGKKISPYYVYEFPTWVSALAVTEANEILLISQYRHGIRETILEIPGGCVDDTDEDFETAIARELREETGYEFSSFQYLGKTSPNSSTNTNWMHMFLATGGRKTSNPKLDHNEDIDVHLISIEELENLLDQHRIPQALHVTAIMYGLRALKNKLG
jgi:ADP-ribose pyrophosphatase